MDDRSFGQDRMEDLEEVYNAWWREAIGHEPYTFQLAILKHRGNLIINKPRQVGVTRAWACLAVEEAGLGRKVLIISNNEKNARHVLEYAQDFINPLIDKGLMEHPTTDQKELVQWKNGGEIRSVAATERAPRGFPAHLVILDEFAWFSKEEGLDKAVYAAAIPTTAQVNGRIMVGSTPHGRGNEFFELWNRNLLPQMTITIQECPHLKVRTVDDAFQGKRYIVGEGDNEKTLTEIAFRQEFLGDFNVTSDAAIPVEALRASLLSDDRELWSLT